MLRVISRSRAATDEPCVLHDEKERDVARIFIVPHQNPSNPNLGIVCFAKSKGPKRLRCFDF